MASTVERIETLRLDREVERRAEFVQRASVDSLTTEADLDLKKLQVQRHIRDSSTASTKSTLIAIGRRREEIEDANQVAVRDATAALAEIEPAYRQARDDVIAAGEAFIEAVRLRHSYSSAWAVASKLGVAGERVPTGGFSPQQAHRWLEAVSLGPW